MFILTVNQLKAAVTILKRTSDLDLIIAKVVRMGPDPILQLPDELMLIDVSCYLPMGKLADLLLSYGPVKPTTEDQKVVITSFVGLFFCE